MKLDRLSSTTPRLSQESMVRAHEVAGERIRRVEALEGVEGDRQRSVQQEILSIEPGAISDFNGGERVLQEPMTWHCKWLRWGGCRPPDQAVPLRMAVKAIDESA
jgi:hypothetical protein